MIPRQVINYIPQGKRPNGLPEVLCRDQMPQ